MNDLPREKLREIIATFERSVYGDPYRCKALLLDLCGEYLPEIQVLISALEEGVVRDLLTALDGTPYGPLLARLTQRLCENRGLDEHVARWGVESWALALGVILDESIETQRARPATSAGGIPLLVRILFQQLRRRQFPLGLDDYVALRQALRAGFGLSSREALRDLCCALWAKSRQEKEVLISLFEQLQFPAWEMPGQEESFVAPPPPEPETQPDEYQDVLAESPPTTQAYRSLPPIVVNAVQLSQRSFVFVPQFPITYREVVQAWRRLRRPLREGPRTELDIDATIANRCRSGITSSVILRPRRRNRVRALLLIDRQGSMTPFHRLSEEVRLAIEQAGRLEQLAFYYFHDVPAEGADETVLAPLADSLFPKLDAILPHIQPLEEGYLYDDPELFSPQPLVDVLRTHAVGANVVLLSDAGAARGRYDLLRLLDTIAFLKALRAYTDRYVWLNPFPRRYWQTTITTAAQIARHVPMFPLDREGLYRAVNILRGQPCMIERPL